MALEDKQYDIVVVGAGVAGIAISEIFSREKIKVLLLDKNEKFASESSAQQHGWFHFGSLYSMFPSSKYLKTLVNGIENLLNYYASFQNMNMVIGKNGILDFDDKANGWFADETIQYTVSSRNAEEFKFNVEDSIKSILNKFAYKMSWELAVKNFICRHVRFNKFDWNTRFNQNAAEYIGNFSLFSYRRDYIKKFDSPDLNINSNTHFRMDGYDRPMRSNVIMQDLLSSFLTNGGEYKNLTEIVSFRSDANAVSLYCSNGHTIRADKVIFSSGSGLNKIVNSQDIKFKISKSPLLVFYPSLSKTNFVRMTPFPEHSINHLLHTYENREYSVVGGATYADANNLSEMEAITASLINNTKKFFKNYGSSKCHQYLGTKVEIISKKSEARNYQYHFDKIADNVYYAIPGKFSLAFSLAVSVFEKITGNRPRNNVLIRTDFDHSIISKSIHQDWVSKC